MVFAVTSGFHDTLSPRLVTTTLALLTLLTLSGCFAKTSEVKPVKVQLPSQAEGEEPFLVQLAHRKANLYVLLPNDEPTRELLRTKPPEALKELLTPIYLTSMRECGISSDIPDQALLRQLFVGIQILSVETNEMVRLGKVSVAKSQLLARQDNDELRFLSFLHRDESCVTDVIFWTKPSLELPIEKLSIVANQVFDREVRKNGST
jgi:hypothetical protein